MPRGRKKANITLEGNLAAVLAQIEETEKTLKDLRLQKKEIEKQIKERKKEQLYEAVVASGKTIEEIVDMINTGE